MILEKGIQMAGQYYCNSCKNFTSEALRKGSGWIEFILYFFYLAPGVIYSIWRRSDEPNVCPVCKKDALIPASMANPIDNETGSNEIRIERECPYCAEKILLKAKVCKHCGGNIESEFSQNEVQINNNHKEVIWTM